MNYNSKRPNKYWSINPRSLKQKTFYDFDPVVLSETLLGMPVDNGYIYMYKSIIYFRIISSTFEHISCNAVTNSYPLLKAVIYRPPPSQIQMNVY